MICVTTELMSPVTTSKLIKECSGYQMGLNNWITLVCVSGYSGSGVEDNEKADEMSRISSSMLSCGPEPQIPVPQ